MLRRAALLTLLFPGVALAQAREEEPSEPIATAYDAPAAECPSADAFFREITGRTSRARAARSGEKARVVHVAVVADSIASGGYLGRLLIEDGATWSSAREVKGATCREVVEALGLIAALAVDPKASTAMSVGANSSDSKEERRPELPPAPVSTPPAAKSGLPARFGVGVQGEGSFVADLVPAIRVFGEVDILRDALLFAPTIRLAIGRSFDVDRQPRVGSATLRYTTGAIDGCPLRVRVGSSSSVVALRPLCAGFSLGVLDAEGAGVGSARSRSRPWSTIDVHARVTWEPIRWLAFGLEGGVLATLFREDFFFEPTVPIYKAPLFAGFLRFGGAVRFP